MEIIQGNCIEILPSLQNKFDLCITSPPYNAGKEYESKLSAEEYTKFAQQWVTLIPGSLKEKGQFWLNVGYMKIGKNSALPLTYLYYPLVQLDLIQEIVWKYEGGMAYKKRFTHRTERWMWFAKDQLSLTFNLDLVRDKENTKYIHDKRNNPLGKTPEDLWHYDRVVGGTGKTEEKTEHPCQFPEKMIERIVVACSNEGDWILDPFCGSGTVAAVCKRLNRNFVGIEINPEYIEITKKRLDKPSLF